MTEVRVEGVMGLIRDFVVGRDSMMLAVCWDAWEGGVRTQLIGQV